MARGAAAKNTPRYERVAETILTDTTLNFGTVRSDLSVVDVLVSFSVLPPVPVTSTICPRWALNSPPWRSYGPVRSLAPRVSEGTVGLLPATASDLGGCSRLTAFAST